MGQPEVLRNRLKLLDEYLSTLYKQQRYSLEEFLSDPERYGSAERFLQLAIEALTDLGNHLIAELNWGSPDENRDIPILFAEHGHIDVELREKWIRMIGFRNLLVHDYTRIDRTRVYDILQHHLGEIEAVKKVFMQFL